MAQLRSLRSLGLPRLVPVLLDLGAKEAALDRSLADLRRTIEADGQPLVALVNNAAVVSVRECVREECRCNGSHPTSDIVWMAVGRSVWAGDAARATGVPGLEGGAGDDGGQRAGQPAGHTGTAT